MTFAGRVTKVYYFSDPIIERSGDFEVICFRDCHLLGEQGKATLPFCPVNLLLPPGEIAASVDIRYEDEIPIAGSRLLLPRQLPRPISSNGLQQWEYDSAFYTSSIKYPSLRNEKVTTHFLNGYGIAISAFTPLQYVPSTGQASYFSKVIVTVETQPDQDAGDHALYYHASLSHLSQVKDIVQNQGMLENYPPRRMARSNDYNYLVITGSSYTSEFDTLANFYKYRGVKAEVVSVSHIDSIESGIDIQQKIRNYIIGEYQDHNIGYVLIGGDVEVVPYRGFYCSVFSGGT